MRASPIVLFAFTISDNPNLSDTIELEPLTKLFEVAELADLAADQVGHLDAVAKGVVAIH